MDAEEERAQAAKARTLDEKTDWSICWWRWRVDRQLCRWPTCCASSSFPSRALSTSAIGRC